MKFEKQYARCTDLAAQHRRIFTSSGRLLESAEGQRNTKSKISGGGRGFVRFSHFMCVTCCRLALF